MRKQILFVVFLCLGIWGLLAAEGSPAALNVLKGINKTTENGNIVIQLEGTKPILNATFYDYPPDKFVVDIPDLDISQVPSKIEISSDVVSAVKLESISNAKDKPLIQLEIEKSALAKCLVSTEGNNLLVKVIREGETGGGAAQQPPQPASSARRSEPVEAPMPVTQPSGNRENAKVLKGIQVLDDGKSVVIEADGQVQYKYFALKNPERLVVDLKGIEKSLTAAKTEGKGAVQQVRANLFKADPPVMRVVLDLASEGSWKVAPVENGVIVTTEDNLASFPKPALQEPAESKAENPKVDEIQPKPEAVAAPDIPVQAQAPVMVEPAIETAAASEIKKNDPEASIKINDNAALENVSVELKPIHSASSKEFKGYDDLFVAQDTSVKAPESQSASAPVVPLSFREKTIAGDETKYSGQPLSLSLKDADVKDVLRLFHDISKLNIVVHPSVQGKVTVDLENVPWDQAMDIVLKNLGLDYIYENNVIWVAPANEISRKFSDKQKLEEEKLNAEPTLTLTKRLSYAKADALKTIITKFLSEKGEIITDKRTNTLIIREVPSRKEALLKLIDTLDASTPQVLIEARIVESTVSWRQQFGISWGGGSNATQNNFPNNQTGFPNFGTGDFAVTLPPPAGNGFIDLMFGSIAGTFNLDVKLSALENTGRGRVISAPKVMTADNEKASIESGRQIPVPIATADKVSVIYINATLKLDVTPHITADGNVNMDVNITNDAVDFQNQTAGSPPPIFKKEAKTVLRVKDGQTAVIGGIFVTTEGISQQGLPFFSKIPVLGWLFKNRTKNRDNSELLIFLTPKIIR
jgi:type IV pilus assembly protein PilQ